jgi:hypothetical protein
MTGSLAFHRRVTGSRGPGPGTPYLGATRGRPSLVKGIAFARECEQGRGSNTARSGKSGAIVVTTDPSGARQGRWAGPQR